MQNLLNEVLKALKSDERLLIDGKLAKNKIVELALAMDEGLITLLLKNKAIKKHFFTKAGEVLVFDKVAFQSFVSNKQFLPDSYTAFKNKIGLTANKEYLTESKEVVLAWPYKDCVLEGGQTKEDQKRDEIFWNETLAPDDIDRLLAPKALSNFKKYDEDGIHKVDTVSLNDNFILKGNNLLAIVSLLKQYEGKIKCIYIDPPYNPTSQANTFAYNNSFNRSSWLVFMKNRLEIAKRLLRQDGVIIVAIDKNEQPRLHILLEEIFPNYDVDCITVIHNARGVIGTNFSYTHEYAIFVTPKGKKLIGNRKIEEDKIDWRQLRDRGGESLRTDAKKCFYPIIVENGKVIGFGEVCKDDEHPKQNEKHGNKIYIYPIDDNDVERKWRYARQTVDTVINVLRVKETKGNYGIEIGKDYGTYKTVWIDRKYDASLNGTQLLKSIIKNNKFTYPKSIYNVIDCINAVVEDDKDAIILDFFAGSGTTAQAVLEINQGDNGNRKYILCEQMEYIQDVTVERIKTVLKNKASGYSFIYCELTQHNANIIDKIELADSTKTLKSIWEEIQNSDFISHKIKPESINKNIKEFETLSLSEQKQFLLSILDKNQLYVNYSDIDDKDCKVSEEDKALNKQFYGEA